MPLSQFPKSMSVMNYSEYNNIPTVNSVYLVRLLGEDSSVFYLWNAHTIISKKIKTLAKRHNLWNRPSILQAQMHFTWVL